MISFLLRKIIGSRNDRLIKQLSHKVERINTLETSIAALNDEHLRMKTVSFKERVNNGESLDALLPEAFAVVREAAKRVYEMRHFDVQLIGGMVLHNGNIAEMRTGEGKTLVATLPVYLNALAGKGVHVVTVNDYLAQRDAEMMGRIYSFLGLTTGINLSHISTARKQAAYAADITYGTNNEFGFDYLRDNMEFHRSEQRQRGHFFGVIDEVDSILIDEARTPLIISGQGEGDTALYQIVDQIIPQLTRQQAEEGEGDFYVDEKARQVFLSDNGHEKAEQLLTDIGLLEEGTSLYDLKNVELMHHLNAALKGHTLYERDKDYVVQNDEVIIVDEFTGRLMAGRRWSDGLHQAVEAKERVTIQKENQTLASITFQNYFRIYNKLAGMTGTADTEAAEFQEIYNLETIIIPTHRPITRKDHMDLIFRNASGKHNAIITDIKSCYERSQPVLVGTTSIESSELLSRLLQKENFPHQVLNAKHHEREAEIIAQAGRPKMITIATNMAGRGTDIVLGGSIEHQIQEIRLNESLDEQQKHQQIDTIRSDWKVLHDTVIEAGGLHIIGTERHESRRIDNQLRGRAGRQGDIGSSRFYLSVEDPLIRVFAGDRMASMMDRLNMPEDEAVEHPWVTKAIESAQRKVEARNFDMRKHVLEYDNVANEQRKVIYEQRNIILDKHDVSETIRDMMQGYLNDQFRTFVPLESILEDWDLAGLEYWLHNELRYTPEEIEDIKGKETDKTMLEAISAAALIHYAYRESQLGADHARHFERVMMLQVLDQLWREHLSALDHLRHGIHLRGYAQKDPKQEYKREAFSMFETLLYNFRAEVVRSCLTVQVQSADDILAAEAAQAEFLKQLETSLGEFSLPEEDNFLTKNNSDHNTNLVAPDAASHVSRNDPCPCGSGLKYKNCHGKIA
ncbi:MAG: preprotein translocase subunit SecA [Pseudomonadota bacterium]